MIQLRTDLPPLPARIARLPVSEKGYPVPWFVAWIDGKPDFRVVGEGKLAIAHRKKRCWLCGEPMGAYKTFVIGPMCAINRVSSEPPSHLDCATFAATACPFLTTPAAKRNVRGLDEIDHKAPAGIGLKRNPGVSLVWTTKRYSPFRAPNGYLFRIGDPEHVEWYCKGREATRAEVDESINSGLPLLMKPALEEGPHAVRALNRCIAEAAPLLPVV